MTFASLLPLVLSILAAWISLKTDVRTLDGIPSAIAAIMCIFCLIWFTIVSPLLIKLCLMLLVLVVARFYLRNLLNLG